MKSIRLNISMRDDMIMNIARAFEKATPCPFTDVDVKNKKSAIASKVYRRFLGKHQDMVNALPDKLFTMRDCFSVAVEQQDMVRMKIYNAKGEVLSMPILPNGSYDQFPIGQITQKQAKEWRLAGKAEQKAIDDWSKQKQQLLDEARQILDSVTTSGQLNDVWPEGCQYLPPHIADPSKGIANFPALTTSRLNSALGIK